MPLDAFHLKRLAVELNEALVRGKINKITQSSKDELTLYIYTKGKVVKLLFILYDELYKNHIRTASVEL